MKQVSIETLKAFAKKNSFNAAMNSGGLDSYSNYIGEDLNEAVLVVSRSRDSDIMSESNFETALDMLGGESETVQVERFGHWACGWVESVTVDPTDLKALRVAFDIKTSLADYPVLDEGHYFESVREELESQFSEYESDFVSNILEALGLDEENIETDEDLINLARYLFEYSESYRGIEEAFVYVDDVPEFLSSLHYGGGLEENPWFQYACAAFDIKVD
jgi:hypothetical protein